MCSFYSCSFCYGGERRILQQTQIQLKQGSTTCQPFRPVKWLEVFSLFDIRLRPKRPLSTMNIKTVVLQLRSSSLPLISPSTRRHSNAVWSSRSVNHHQKPFQTEPRIKRAIACPINFYLETIHLPVLRLISRTNPNWYVTDRHDDDYAVSSVTGALNGRRPTRNLPDWQKAFWIS